MSRAGASRVLRCSRARSRFQASTRQVRALKLGGFGVGSSSDWMLKFWGAVAQAEESWRSLHVGGIGATGDTDDGCDAFEANLASVREPASGAGFSSAFLNSSPPGFRAPGTRPPEPRLQPPECASCSRRRACTDRFVRRSALLLSHAGLDRKSV